MPEDRIKNAKNIMLQTSRMTGAECTYKEYYQRLERGCCGPYPIFSRYLSNRL